MLDLEKRIQEWRNTFAGALSTRAEVIDELENHLREEVQRLVQAGETLEQAWVTALNCLGTPQQIAGEFRKVPPRSEPWLAGRVVLGGWALVCLAALLGWFLFTKSLQGQMDWLLAVHVATIATGYLALFAAGTLGAWSLLHRALRGWEDRRAAAFRYYAFRMTLPGALLTAIGVALGACWAREHLGRVWGWDVKEIGGLAVLAWQVLLLACLQARRTGPWPLVTGVAGNIVVSMSWFGPVAVAPAHSYGQTGMAMGLAAFVVVQILIALLALVPPRGLVGKNI